MFNFVFAFDNSILLLIEMLAQYITIIYYGEM